MCMEDEMREEIGQIGEVSIKRAFLIEEYIAYYLNDKVPEVTKNEMYRSVLRNVKTFERKGKRTDKREALNGSTMG